MYHRENEVYTSQSKADLKKDKGELKQEGLIEILDNKNQNVLFNAEEYINLNQKSL
jgi:hypothetical protein